MKKALARKGGRKISRFVYWAPRILSIIFIIFLSLFALDIFGMGLGFWGTIVGLFMHLIPSFILLIVLLIAWRIEWVGGAVFILFGLWYIIALGIRGPLSWHLTIAGPALLVGILFIVDWILKRKS